jgi:hypothetical protein
MRPSLHRHCGPPRALMPHHHLFRGGLAFTIAGTGCRASMASSVPAQPGGAPPLPQSAWPSYAGSGEPPLRSFPPLSSRPGTHAGTHGLRLCVPAETRRTLGFDEGGTHWHASKHSYRAKKNLFLFYMKSTDEASAVSSRCSDARTPRAAVPHSAAAGRTAGNGGQPSRLGIGRQSSSLRELRK